MKKGTGGWANDKIREAFDLPHNASEERLKKSIGQSIRQVCKPCWELKY